MEKISGIDLSNIKMLFVFPNIHILTPKIFPMECGLLSTYVKQYGRSQDLCG